MAEERQEAPEDGREARRGRGRRQRPGKSGADGAGPPLEPVAAPPGPGAPDEVARSFDPKGGSGPPEVTDGGVRKRPLLPTALRALLGMTLLAMLALWGLALWALAPVSNEPELIEFEVQPGWGAARVSKELERQGLVRDDRLFSLYLRLRGLDRSMGEGLYDLDRSASAPEIARALTRGGRPRVVRVLIPEGLRAADLVERLEAAGLGDGQEYLRIVERPDGLAPPYLPPGASLEGYLFPASYELPVSASPEEVVRRLIQRFDNELDARIRSQLGRIGLSVHEWVILASMVQAEAGNDGEMGIIAGVFLNRLEREMALQSDPTVAYGLGKPLPDLDPLAGDMRKDHPWNTYTRPGLPAGPISNPGRAALRAVLAPVTEDASGRPYLYFLHGSDQGRPVFRPNTALEGHNRDVARYLRGQ